MGITLLHESAFNDLNTAYSAKVAIDNPPLKRAVGIIIPKNRNLAPSERVFYNFIQIILNLKSKKIAVQVFKDDISQRSNYALKKLVFAH